MVKLQLFIIETFGTTVTKAVDTTVPTQLSRSYHSFGTTVTTALEQV